MTVNPAACVTLSPFLRSRRFLGGVGVGFLTALGVRVRFFCPTTDVRLDHFVHYTLELGIPVEMVQFLLKLLLKQISCCVPRFPLILTVKFHSIYVKESESDILEAGVRDGSRKLWKCQVFYLRHRNTVCHLNVDKCS